MLLLLIGCVQWNAYTAQQSLNAVQYLQFKTLDACQQACVSSVYCVAIDFDSTSDPCWLHFSADDLQTKFNVDGVTQYILNRTCPLTPTPGISWSACITVLLLLKNSDTDLSLRLHANKKINYVKITSRMQIYYVYGMALHSIDLTSVLIDEFVKMR
jgi:hypothetical protein